IKIQRNFFCIFYDNICRKPSIESLLDGIRLDMAFCMKICHLSQCMNSCICPAGRSKNDLCTCNYLYFFLDYTLDCWEIMLNLPACVIGAFVFNEEFDVTHEDGYMEWEVGGGFIFLLPTPYLLLPGFYRYSFIKICAICTPLRAAPLRRLSDTIHILMPFGMDSSSLILPTNTSSLSEASIGIGYSFFAESSTTFTPGAFERSFFTSFAVIFFSVSILTASEWLLNTGTRTVVAVTFIESSSIIFFFSFTIFISFFLLPLSRKTSICGMQLNAI